MLTAERLREALDYDAETGVFRWRERPGKKSLNTRLAGKIAGTLDDEGYRSVYLFGRIYKAHRLAWLHAHGRWPCGVIDHVNRIPDDNRLANLREASMSQNQHNRGANKNNPSGCKGVCWDPKKRKWRARIAVNGREISIGRFSDLAEAHRAYAAAAKRLHGEFARIS